MFDVSPLSTSWSLTPVSTTEPELASRLPSPRLLILVSRHPGSILGSRYGGEYLERITEGETGIDNV